MAPVVYLISGANRGIGLELVKHIAARDNTIVYAGVRNPDTATALQHLVTSHATKSKIHILHLISADELNNRDAVSTIQRISGRLDVVIANAGIAHSRVSTSEIPLDAMREHYEVNVLGPLALFQAAWPLLKASTDAPKFVPISSTSGSIERASLGAPKQVAYGASKAALNWVTRKIWAEHEGLIAFPICPGANATDLMDAAIQDDPAFAYVKDLAIPAEEGAALVLQRIDEATRETNMFISRTGATIPW